MHFIQCFFEMSDTWNDNAAEGASWDPDKKEDGTRWGRKPEGKSRNGPTMEYLIAGN